MSYLFSLLLFALHPSSISVDWKELGVTVEHIDLSTQGIQIDGCSLKNPSGCRYPFAVLLDSIHVECQWQGLAQRPVFIQAIELGNVSFCVEYQDGERTNWQQIAEKARRRPTKKGYFIKKLSAQSVDLEVYKSPLETKKYKIDHLFLENVEIGAGALLEESINHLVLQIMEMHQVEF